MNYLVYKITNLLNNMIYIGAHKTMNVNDNYFGSSKYLRADVKLYGKVNFKKEILFVYDNIDDMINKEAELVNKEFCHRTDTYNRIIGGSHGSFNFIGMTNVKDKDGNIIKVYLDDPRYLSGELISVHKGKVTVKDKDGKTLRVNLDDSRYLSGELIFEKTGMLAVKDKDGNILHISKNDSRYTSGELVHVVKNTVTVKDKEGNILQVDKNDLRYLSGELTHNLKDTIVVKDKDGNRFCVDRNDPRYLSGELVSWCKGRPGIKSMLGKHVSDEVKESLRRQAKLRVGDKASGFGTIWINNGTVNKRILKSESDNYLNIGWIKGRFK